MLWMKHQISHHQKAPKSDVFKLYTSGAAWEASVDFNDVQQIEEEKERDDSLVWCYYKHHLHCRQVDQ